MVKKFDSALDALNAVAELERRNATINIGDDFEVVIKSLGAEDETATFVDCMNTWGQAFVYKHKIETLSRSITQINGMSTETIDLNAKKLAIGQWQQVLVDHVYREYATLVGDIDEYFEKIKLTAETNVVGYKQNQIKKEEEQKKENSNEPN
jgi:hypothetical protein